MRRTHEEDTSGGHMRRTHEEDTHGGGHMRRTHGRGHTEEDTRVEEKMEALMIQS